MTWKALLAPSYTDGIAVLHRGRIVHERYAGCLRETGVHAAMSMTKSLTGLLAEILVAEGALDDGARGARADGLCRSGSGDGDRALRLSPIREERGDRPDLSPRLPGACGAPHAALKDTGKAP